jgi:hypothetical protein
MRPFRYLFLAFLAAITTLSTPAAEPFPGDTGEAFVIHASPRADSPFPAAKAISRIHLIGNGSGGLTLVLDAVDVAAANHLMELWPTLCQRPTREEVRAALAAATIAQDGDRITIRGQVPAALRDQLIQRLSTMRGAN